MSQPVERLLKRMIAPNADLRCTAAELTGDPYWDANPVTPVHGHSTLRVFLFIACVHAFYREIGIGWGLIQRPRSDVTVASS